MLALPYIALFTGVGILVGILAYHLVAGKSFQNETLQSLKATLQERNMEIQRLKLEVLALQKQLLHAGSETGVELQNHMQELQKRISELHLALYQQKKAYEKKLAQKEAQIAHLKAGAFAGQRTKVHRGTDSIPDADFIHLATGEDEGGTLWESDDLTLIEGITAEIAAALYQLGVRKYEEIARWSSLDIRRIAGALGMDPREIIEQNWVLQAQMLWYERYKR